MTKSEKLKATYQRKRENGITENEKKFLELANTPALRQALLDRLEKLGLLSAFLQAESGTKQ